MSDLIEYNVGRSVVATLKAAAITALIQEQGYKKTADGVEEWLSYDLIHAPQMRSRAGVYMGKFFFQVGCHTVGARDRSDLDTGAHWKLAGKVRAALSKKTIKVLDYAESSQPGLAYLKVQESQSSYNPDREQLSSGGGQSVSGDTGVHYVIVSFTGTLTQRS